MQDSSEYRAKAIEILLQAGRASDDEIRSELLSIAASYARLVDRAEQNAGGFLARMTPARAVTHAAILPEITGEWPAASFLAPAS